MERLKMKNKKEMPICPTFIRELMEAGKNGTRYR